MGGGVTSTMAKFEKMAYDKFSGKRGLVVGEVYLPQRLKFLTLLALKPSFSINKDEPSWLNKSCTANTNEVKSSDSSLMSTIS